MRTAHEGMEMDPGLVLKRQTIKESIDEVGFTAPDPAPDVGAGHRGPARAIAAKQLPDEAVFGGARSLPESIMNGLQPPHGFALSRVRGNQTTFKITPVTGGG